MSLWHDFVNSPPPPGSAFILRRYPEVTNQLPALWSPDFAGALVTDASWFLPWAFITRWKAAVATPPPDPPTDFYANFPCDDSSPTLELANVVDAFPQHSRWGPATLAPGKFGTAVQLTAGFGYSWLSDDTAHWVFPGAFTLRFWFNPQFTPGYHSFLGGSHWSLMTQSDHPNLTLIFELLTATGYVTAQSTPFAPDAWTYVCCWFDPAVGIGIQVNNAAPSQVPFTGSLPPLPETSPWGMGMPSGTNPVLLDEIAFWSRALSAAERAADYAWAPQVQFAQALQSPLPLLPSVWRDLYPNMPADGQLCYVRRCPLDTAPFHATWCLTAEPYFLLENGWQLPWYLAWQWKPHPA